MNRDRLIWSEVLRNHVHEVPPRLFSVVRSYLFARSDLEGGR
jgi:hypothetical protein